MSFNPQSWTQNIVITPLPSLSNSLVVSGTYTAGNLPLVGGGSVFFKEPIFPIITAAGNESANIFTITGLNANGNIRKVTVNGPNAGTLIIQTSFFRIDSISIKNNAAGVISIGNDQSTATAWVPLDKNANQFAVNFGVDLSADASLVYTVQFGMFDHQNGFETVENDSILVSQSASGSTYLFNEPFDAARLLINSHVSGSACFMVRPSGLASAGSPINPY